MNIAEFMKHNLTKECNPFFPEPRVVRGRWGSLVAFDGCFSQWDYHCWSHWHPHPRTESSAALKGAPWPCQHAGLMTVSATHASVGVWCQVKGALSAAPVPPDRAAGKCFPVGSIFTSAALVSLPARDRGPCFLHTGSWIISWSQLYFVILNSFWVYKFSLMKITQLHNRTFEKIQ